MPQTQRIQGLYADLSAQYDRMQTLLEHLCRPNEIAVAAVLSEDLQSLVEECEEFFIGGCAVNSEQIRSFESRSETVLEELEQLEFLNPRPPVQHFVAAHI